MVVCRVIYIITSVTTNGNLYIFILPNRKFEYFLDLRSKGVDVINR